MAKNEVPKSMSKTAFVIMAFIIAFIFIMTPFAGLMAGKVLGALSIGWVIGGLLLAGLMAMMDSNNYKLNNDLKWKYSFKLDELSDKIEEVSEHITDGLSETKKFNPSKGKFEL